MSLEQEAPVISQEDYEAAQQLANEELAKENPDPEQIKLLREIVGNGNSEVVVSVGDKKEQTVRKVNQIGNLVSALTVSNPDELAKNAFPTPYEGNGRR